VLVGDQDQLSPIGAGGLFDSVRSRVPSAELTEVHRARDQWERDAWAQVRAGDAAPALAAYRARDRLHISGTREEAGGRMVDDWDRARRDIGERGCVMIGDASNAELDRLNALAQDRRLQAGELGADRAELPGRPYGLHADDEVLLTGHSMSPVESAWRTEPAPTSPRHAGKVILRTEEPQPREVRVDTRRFSELRLAYAQHVYKAQGATVDRALVLTGGWQTDRESAYVAVTRARQRTDLYVSREDLGEDGMDDGAIQRLSERIVVSRAQQASITQAEAPRHASIGRGEEPAHASVTEGQGHWQGALRQIERSEERVEESIEQVPGGSPGVRRESVVGRILRERKELEAQRAIERGRGRD
jgi:ATP-dependent exoDNAse (exonuclease V) alpha subunit